MDNIMDSSVQELIKRAKNGCDDSFAYIFELYRPVVMKTRHQYYLRYFDLDDWLQEGRIVCYESILTYRFDLGVTFGSYFRGNFQRCIISMIRRQEAYKRKSDRMSIYLNDLTEESQVVSLPSDEDYSAKISIDYIFIREEMKAFPELMSKKELEMFICTLHTDSVKQSRVDRSATSRMKRKFISCLV